MLTSGELAKLCNVSLRTVQFYDKKDLVKASVIQEGNRRYYDASAIEDMRFVCLCRTLGFSLQEIKAMQQQKREGIDICLQNKKQELHEQLKRLEVTISQLDILLENIHRPKAELRQDILEEFETKKNLFHHTTQKQQYFLFLFVFMEISLFICMSMYGVHPLLVCFMILVGLSALIYYHARHNAYICPKCHTYFECSCIQDIMMLNNGR